MPPLPVAAGVIKVTCNYTVGTDTAALSRFFIHYAGTAPTVAQLNTFATSIRTAWSGNLASLHAASIVLTSVNCEDLSSATGAVGSDAVSVPGTRTGSTMVGAACVMVQFIIARRYRGSKPKIFFPFGVVADTLNMQNWTSGLTTATSTGFIAFINAIVAAGWTGASTLNHVNVSYFSGFTVVTNPITHRARNVPTLRGTPLQDNVTGYAVEPGIASQRRRNVV